MADITSILFNAAAKQGINIVAKTQYGPAFTIYNANAPASPPNPLTKLIGPVGIQVRDATGKVLYSAGQWPATNPLAIGALVALLAAAGYAGYKKFTTI